MKSDAETTPHEQPTRPEKKHRRGHGLGCLFKRGKTYYGKIVIDGKPIVRSLGTGDTRKVQAAFAEFLRPFELGDKEKALKNLQGRLNGAREERTAYEESRPALTLSQGFEAYRASRERPDSGPRTMAGYESQYQRLIDWAEGTTKQEAHAPGVEMRHFTRELATAFADDLAGKLSSNSFNKYLTLFRRVWDVLKDEARIAENPWEKIRPQTLETFTRRELTVDELRRVCESVDGEMRTLFAVGIYTGLRLGDCALLDWGAVDIERRIITLTPRKTARHAHGKPVLIPIHNALADILAATPRTKRMGYVMPQTAATYLRNPPDLSHAIQDVFKNCGIATQAQPAKGGRARVAVGFHSLRHTFVSLSANAGAPLALIQSIVGHSNPSMTRHYFHESEAALKNAVAELPDLISD